MIRGDYYRSGAAAACGSIPVADTCVKANKADRPTLRAATSQQTTPKTSQGVNATAGMRTPPSPHRAPAYSGYEPSFEMQRPASKYDPITKKLIIPAAYAD